MKSLQRRIILCHFFGLLTLILLGQNQNGLIAIDIKDLIYEYNSKGFEHYNNENLDSAEYFLTKALDLEYAEFDILDDRVVYTHITLAAVYRLIYKYELALYHLERAEAILKEYDPTSPQLAVVYNNKGNIISATNDVYRTKEYYEYALSFLTRANLQNTDNFVKILSNYITLLFSINEIDLAEEQLSRMESIPLDVFPKVKIRFYILYATSLSHIGKKEDADVYFEKSRAMISTGRFDSELAILMLYYQGIIDHQTREGDFAAAQSSISQALISIEMNHADTDISIARYSPSIQYRKAFILYMQGSYDHALIVLDNAISSITSVIEKNTSDQSIPFISTSGGSLLPELQILKGRSEYALFAKNNDVSMLEKAYKTYEEVIASLNSLRLSMKDENSSVFVAGKILEVYSEAANTGIQLYKRKHDKSYLENSFLFAESSKSFALYSSIKDLEIMEFADLPTHIKDQEKRLTGEIQGYENILFEEGLLQNPDSLKIDRIEEKLFHLKDDLNTLKEKLETENPNYYKLKYNPTFISLKETQAKLPYHGALIEYVLNDTSLITYVVDRKGINVFTQVVDKEFESECLKFYQIMQGQDFSVNAHDNYKNFVKLGRKLFKVLVEPALAYTDRTNLIIVPDGAIHYVPFEALLLEDSDSEYINYMALPYLIEEYSIGYSHSATMMFEERIKTRSPEHKVLAFAPEYYSPYYSLDSAAKRQAFLDEDYLVPLHGIIEEVQSIKATVPSIVYMNSEATEGNFKRQAGNFNVLHLAMHTIMRDDNPLNSHLAFTTMEVQDTTEDNKLFAYEIYSMKLNAQMAVLSSCNSGYGELKKGEGMMSLARGFIYAGCPSIVMTLWQVSDKSSSELMTSFYQYLKRGKSKQEALRLAKLDYLKSADELTSNPYFWSAFVIFGDESPIYKKSGITYWLIIILSFMGIMVYFQYGKKSSFRFRRK
ncbi:MAG: CHAT domain-containing tetratricopeptide repeat protein [Bacteroidales bacterium]